MLFSCKNMGKSIADFKNSSTFAQELLVLGKQEIVIQGQRVLESKGK